MASSGFLGTSVFSSTRHHPAKSLTACHTNPHHSDTMHTVSDHESLAPVSLPSGSPPSVQACPGPAGNNLPWVDMSLNAPCGSMALQVREHHRASWQPHGVTCIRWDVGVRRAHVCSPGVLRIRSLAALAHFAIARFRHVPSIILPRVRITAVIAYLVEAIMAVCERGCAECPFLGILASLWTAFRTILSRSIQQDMIP